MEQLQKQKKKRSTHRSLITRLTGKIEEHLAVGETSVDIFEELLEQLTDKALTLGELDKDIDQFLSEAEIEAETIASSDYRDKIITYKTKLHKRIKDLNSAADNNKVIADRHDTEQTNRACCSTLVKTVKLPKLQINKFYGDLDKYMEFWNQYDSAIHSNSSLSTIDKFNYLKTLLAGTAQNAISGFSLTQENYQAAIDLLQERFGRKDMLLNAHLNNLLNIAPLKNPENIRELRYLYDKCEIQIRSLQSLGVGSETYGSLLCPLLLKLLPSDLTLQFTRTQEKSGSWNIDNLLHFLRNEIESRERASFINGSVNKHSDFKRQDFPKFRPEDKRKFPNKVNSSVKSKVFTNKCAKEYISSASELIAPVKDNNNKCIFCSSQHENETCSALTVNQKKDTLKQQGRCFLCLQRNHRFAECQAQNCKHCLGKHNIALCFKKEKDRTKKNDNHADGDNVNMSHAAQNHVGQNADKKYYLQTASAVLRGPRLEKRSRLLCDSGSMRSFVRSDLARELSLPVKAKENLLLYTFGSGVASEKRTCDLVEVRIKNNVSGEDIIVFALVIEEITGAVLEYPSDEIREQIKARGIVLADDVESETDNISLLIGADNYWKIVTGKNVHLDSGLVMAESRIGWLLFGHVSDKKKNRSNTYVSSAVAITALHIGSSSIENMWRLDSLGIRDPVETKSREERELAAIELFEKTISVDEENRYQVCLPWLPERSQLKSNLEIATQRCISTTKGLLRKNRYDQYDAVFEEWINEGFIEEVSSEPLEDISCHYLPHRGIFKQHSTTPLRPIFDASCCGKHSLSLNHCLEKGPNLLEQIPPILMRFRKDKIGVVSDIRKAFLQISVHKSDREFLRFLWWKNYKENEFKILRHKRVVFGLNCSPFLLSAVLNYHFETHSSKFPDIVEILRQSFYVDNCVTSVPNEEFLRRFIKESSELLRLGCFDLRGWEHTCIDFDDFSEPTPVLGILWDRYRDVLFCDVKDFEKPPDEITRRKVLSTVHKVFDPLGALCPATLFPKLLIQKSWVQGTGWDNPLPDDQQREFKLWFKDLQFLRDVMLPRSLDICDEGTELSLHTFCDSSKYAYSTVVFLRKVKNGNVSLHFIQAKSRVAPLRKTTIPRLELLGCCIGARLSSTIIQVLKLDNIPCYYWTDSSTALTWIKKEDHWGVFVGNRVTEIRNLTSHGTWRHVPTNLNPADLPSRGCTGNRLLNSKWLSGPDWLKENEENWPNEKITPKEEEVSDERRKTTLQAVACNTGDTTGWYLKYFSRYSQVVRMVAWMLRFVRNCRNPAAKMKGELTVEEIELAEKKIVKQVQSESFKDANALKGFCTFLDTDEVLRLKTKISRRNDEEYFLFPMLLPSRHELVERLILDYHSQSSHAGVQFVLNDIRKKFWILRGRKTVQRVLSKCVRCKRFRTKNIETMPAPLPEDRVRDALIFEVTGVDVAGPLFLKRNEKAWILIFTCAVYRAVHLELIEGLSTNAFFLGLRRFIARRGRPAVLYSDNGSNFVGAENLLKTLDWDQLIRDTSTMRIKWKFNPPSAPWWGGFFERLIQMVKKLLRRVLGKACVTYEELSTILCDVESVINSRPLTYLTESPDDLVPLTPSMFLQDVQETGTPDLDQLNNIDISKRLRYSQRLREQLRARFREEYLSLLVQRSSKVSSEPIKENDLVLIGSDNKKRLNWPVGRVIDTYPGKDKEVRVVKVKTASGELVRPVRRLYPLEISQNDYLSEQARDKLEPKDCMNDVRCSKEPETVPEKTVTTKSGRRVIRPQRYQ